jgi:two-component system phosphate regulon sensor histidine kinase PhoR
MLTNKRLRTIAFLAVLSLGGLVLIQLYWIRKAHYLTSSQFGDRVTLALTSVSSHINRFHQDSTSVFEPVNRMDDATFSVSVKGLVGVDFMRNLLQVEFSRFDIEQSFSFAMYDCFTDSIQWYWYKNIETNDPEFSGLVARPLQFPQDAFTSDNHFFVVHFPHWDSFIFRQMGLMTITTLGILVVMGIFAYLVILIFKQKRLNEIREDFINNMTHEFKTPIATLTVAGEALGRDAVNTQPEKVKKYGKVILDESNRLKSQVENILKMAVLDANRTKMDMEPISMHTLIEQIREPFLVRIQAAGGQFMVLTAATDPMVMGNRDHLANVLFNLLDNALKYSGPSPVIRLETRNHGKKIEISVADNGKGIPKEAQRHVFEKFYRVPTGNVHNVKGFGLGLSYVKKIVQLHEGKIRLVSKPERGTSFIIQLKTLKNV